MADWQKGDLALCLVDGNESNVHKGAIYHVQGLVGGIIWSSEIPAPGLILGGVEHPQCFFQYGVHAVSARVFRKITPGAKIEGIEEPRRIKVPKPVREDA